MAMRFELDSNAFENLDAIAQEYIADSLLPEIVTRAKRIVPVDTGNLHDNIRALITPEGNFVIADTEYAAYVELGTSKMSAQPYLRPSMTSALPEKKR